MDDAAIVSLIARGAADHPDIPEPPGLREQLAACLAEGARDLESRAADLYLAAACAAGDHAAIARFDADLPGTVHRALARLGLSPSDANEVVQRVRIALLVRDEAGHCGLAGYSGRGNLRAYVRAVAVRTALKWFARERAPLETDDDERLAELPGAGDLPDLALLKQRCRDGVREAFTSALASLTPRERTLLRQHYVDGLTVEILGSLYRVHRSTCARQIEAARNKILRGIRNHLRQALALADDELENAVALARSQLDLSLTRQLASRDD